MDTGLPQCSNEKIELAILWFLDQFRKTYVGDRSDLCFLKFTLSAVWKMIWRGTQIRGDNQKGHCRDYGEIIVV